MDSVVRSTLVAAALFFSVALVGGSLVALTHEATRERIAANERAALLRSLNELVAPTRYENDLFEDALVIRVPELAAGRPVTVYRARDSGGPVAALAVVEAGKGYGGPITLLIAVNANGTVEGVRALAHRETAGLGDAIELRHSEWIRGFDGRSLGTPPTPQWAVTKDGGMFDELSGATTTARAVVQAVRDFLLYFGRNRERIFRPGTHRSE